MSSILQEIQAWPIEARDDATERYFYYFDDVSKIENGTKNFIIGRKGSGKTAIAEYIYRKRKQNRKSFKLSFKSFPFEELYSNKDTAFTASNQYISLWKYVIYCCICKMMTFSDDVDESVKQKLRNLFSFELEKALASAVSRLTDRSFNLSVLGVGMGVGGKGAEARDALSWRQKNEILLHFIKQHIGEDEYFVLFDELDEVYRHIFTKITTETRDYFDLLSCLFKACQDIRYELSEHKANIRLCIFLRDDIYDLISDPDKNKWRDRAIDLKWKNIDIKNLIAFRISRADSEKGGPLSFQKAWNLLFSGTKIEVGSGRSKTIELFDFIQARTLGRPRDYISYLRECASLAVKMKVRLVSADMVREAGGAHSDYLRREISDEIESIIPNIDDVFDVLSTIRRQTLTNNELMKALIEARVMDQNPALSPEKLIEILYHMGVVGNIARGGFEGVWQVFRHNTSRSRLNPREPLCVHPGLFKALQIL